MELDSSEEAGIPDYWCIHAEEDSDGEIHLCVYETRKEAKESAKGRDHKSRVVPLVRVQKRLEFFLFPV